MTTRIFWFAVGTAAGVYVVTRLKRRLAPLTPEGMSRNLERAQDSATTFAARVRDGMAQREAELRVALGLDEQASGPSADHPTGPQARAS